MSKVTNVASFGVPPILPTLFTGKSPVATNVVPIATLPPKIPAQPDSQIGVYKMDKTIGQGTYGKVKLGINVFTDEKVAIKIIEKSQIQSPKQVARLQREIRFLKLLHHPHIVKVIEVIETNDFIYIVMEYAIGGELFDYIVANKRVKEKEARSFYRMVLSAVDYCHKNAVIHRDLKPENLLLDVNKSIKIIDFGFGNNFTFDRLLDTFCGSPFYAAPEMILGKKYEGPEVDMWSLGVILFALLCGHLPFDDDNMKELYKKIASGSYICPDYLMPNARHLISRLITVDPKKRATLEEVLHHPWVNEGYPSAPPNYVPQRVIITDASLLSHDIISRLITFGYKLEDIYKAFSMEVDHHRPDPIRSTYFLLVEMLQREEIKLLAERKRAQTHLQQMASNTTLSLNSLSGSGYDGFMQHYSSEPNIYNGHCSSVTTSNQLINAGAYFTQSQNIIYYEEKTHSQQQQQQQYSQRSYHPNMNMPAGGFEKIEMEATPKNLDMKYGIYPSTNAANTQRNPPTMSYPVQQAQSLLPPPIIPGSKIEHLMDIDTLGETSRLQQPPIQRTSVSSWTPSQPSDSVSFHSEQRRVSSPSPVSGGSSTTTSSLNIRMSQGKIRDELRTVSGWFLNVSTTSSKPPAEIIDEVVRVLENNGAYFQFDSQFILTCEVDGTYLTNTASNHTMSVGNLNAPATCGGGNVEPITQKLPLPDFPSDLTLAPGFSKKPNKNTVMFQVEVCSVPRMSLYGLHFKRLHGGVWNYKKVCNRLLSEMSI